MEHTPRFDQRNEDPNSLKPKLAKLANATLSQQWLTSPLKDQIIIGRHSLESPGTGARHSARYVDQRTGRYDGVHLYGQTGCADYTESVNTIFMLAQSEQNQGVGNTQTENHSTCPQAEYQKANPVPTKNRFSVFNSNSKNL